MKNLKSFENFDSENWEDPLEVGGWQDAEGEPRSQEEADGSDLMWCPDSECPGFSKGDTCSKCGRTSIEQNKEEENNL